MELCLCCASAIADYKSLFNFFLNNCTYELAHPLRNSILQILLVTNHG